VAKVGTSKAGGTISQQAAVHSWLAADAHGNKQTNKQTCPAVFMAITIVVTITYAIIGKAIFMLVTTAKPCPEILTLQVPRFNQSLLCVIIYISSHIYSYLAVMLFHRFLRLLDDLTR
jgi:hypothetical protein